MNIRKLCDLVLVSSFMIQINEKSVAHVVWPLREEKNKTQPNQHKIKVKNKTKQYVHNIYLTNINGIYFDFIEQK